MNSHIMECYAIDTKNNINLCTIKNLHEYRIILFILRILIYKCAYAFIHARIISGKIYTKLLAVTIFEDCVRGEEN